MNKPIIEIWEYDGQSPIFCMNTPIFDCLQSFNVSDDQEELIFRVLADVKKQKPKTVKIGQLLTNKNIEDLTVSELQLALASINSETVGSRDDLVKRLRSAMILMRSRENININ